VEEDKLKPTRPLSSYIYFSSERTKQIKATGKSQIEAMKQCGAEWNTLTEEQKAPYNAKNKADELRYQAQKKELEEKGYFIMQDGSKSTDHEVPTSRKRKSAGLAVSDPKNKTTSALTAKKPKSAVK